jgi:spermidine synthase
MAQTDSLSSSERVPHVRDDFAESDVQTTGFVADGGASVGFVVVAAGAVGFAFFLMELVWYRLLAPLLGGSVFTFGLVLATALCGIGIGGLAYALLSRAATLTAFATSCLLEAVCVAATFALGDHVALLTLRLQPSATAGFAVTAGAWTIVSAIVILPPSLIAGFQFPLLIALFGRGRNRLGLDVGLAYAANTAGAISGSLAGGFGLLPWMSAQGAWRLVVVVLLLVGGIAAVLDTSMRHWRGLIRHAVTVAFAVGLLFAPGPTAVWRHSGIGARRAPNAAVLSSPNNLRAWRAQVKNQVLWEGDGTESGVALIADPSGYAFLVNGKSDGSARADAGTQVMLGLLAALKHPNPRRALVIGLGTGSSAGWLGDVPDIERVDVVELESRVLDVARACHAVNRNVMTNPKVAITVADAREILLTGRQQYDIIASEPSNPYRAGIASLFTQEFYRAANQQLTPDGVFAQWIQAYEIDSQTLSTIYATMGSVFADIESWETTHGDLVLLGTRRQTPYNIRTLAERIAREPFKSALLYTWRAVDVHGVLAHHVARDFATRAMATKAHAPINTDDRNVVEFGLARAVGRPLHLTSEIRKLARQSSAEYPNIEDGEINWPAVDTAWLSYIAGQGASITDTAGPWQEQTRQRALSRYFEKDDIAGARELWNVQGEGPRDLNELAMVADIEARYGSPAALPLIQRLRALQPGEADTILASLHLRQSNVGQAADSLERAFTRFRSDPWALTSFERKALALAPSVAVGPVLTRRIFEALAEPFANLAVDQMRLLLRAELALSLPAKNACLATIDAFGQKTPWSERFVQLRRDCYEANQDPRLAHAARELSEFFAHEPPSISLGAERSSSR